MLRVPTCLGAVGLLCTCPVLPSRPLSVSFSSGTLCGFFAFALSPFWSGSLLGSPGFGFLVGCFLGLSFGCLEAQSRVGFLEVVFLALLMFVWAVVCRDFFRSSFAGLACFI